MMVRKILKPYMLPLILLSTLTSCGGDGDDNDDIVDAIDQVPTIAPIESVVKTAVPLSYAATVAMDTVVNGTTFPNVVRSNTCGSFPCVATLSITVQATDLPVELNGINDGGEIFIAGLWSSATQAILTVVFTDIDAGNDFLSVRKISTIPVSRQNDITTVVYSNVDIDIASEPEDSINLDDTEIQGEYNRLNQTVDMDPEINVNMDAWVIEADSNGTAGDLSDDEYFIVGGGQYFEAGLGEVSVLQIGIVGLLMTSDCALNPTDGLTVLQEVNISTGERSTWPILGQALIEFQPTCDGTAEVLLGTGSFFLASGDDIDLGFND